MIKSKKKILSIVLCVVATLFLALGVFTGIIKPNFSYASAEEQHGFIVTKSDGSEATGIEYAEEVPEGTDYFWEDDGALWILSDDLIITGQGLENEAIYVGYGDNDPTTITLNNLKSQKEVHIYSDNDFTLTLKGQNQIGTLTNKPDVGLSFLYSNLTITGDGNLTIIDRSEGILAGSQNEYKNFDLKFDENFTGKITIWDEGYVEEPEPQPPCAISLGTGTLTIDNGTFLFASETKSAITAGSIIVDENLSVYSGDSAEEVQQGEYSGNEHIAYISNLHVETVGESVQEFIPWVSNNALPSTTGKYFLTSDITLTETWTVPQGETNLCLNGHVIKQTAEASVITVNNGATLNLYDCDTTTVHNGYVDADGLWHLDEANSHELSEGETEKDITGGIITGGNAVNGGGVNVAGTFNMYGGTITGNTAISYGGGVYVEAGTFGLSGGTVSSNTAEYGGGVFTQNDGIFEMSDGTICGNTAISYGGGGVHSKGTSTVSGGAISGNTATSWGGGVYVEAGTFGLSGGTVSSNTAKYGGGVFTYSIFEMSDGTICGNTAISYGGGVYVEAGTFGLFGGTVSSNTAEYGGGIQNDGTMNLLAAEGMTIAITDNEATGAEGGVANSGTLSLSGKVIIKDNICTGKYEDEDVTYPVNLATNAPITIAGELTGSEIGITLIDEYDKHDLGVLTDGFMDNNPGAKLGDFFHYDGPDTFIMALNDSGEPEVKNAPHVHDMGTDDAADDITFTAWTSENSLPGSSDLTDNVGSYYLTKDVTLSATWTVPTGTVNLCLNGHVINANGGAFSVITVGENAILNLYDCGTRSHNGYVDSNGLWHYDSTGTYELQTGETEKDITGGIITGGNPNGTDANTGNNQAGGGVYVKGEFNMYGGTIAGNEATTNGGGVYVLSGGKFTISSGKIKFNKASNGGGVATKVALLR